MPRALPPARQIPSSARTRPNTAALRAARPTPADPATGAPRACEPTQYISRGSSDNVPEAPQVGSPLSLLTLRETRRFIGRFRAILLTAAFVIVYAFGSMVLGGMLIFANLGGGYQILPIWGNGLGTDTWSYPALLISAPWGFVELPFFATLSMVVVSIGVGIGMSVAVLLGISLVRTRRRTAGRPAAVGTVAGLTPAMIALVTLGACCSTTAAATAGVGLVAQVSGSTTNNLLLNNWFLGVFQMVVVWTALVAQELVLRVYGGLFGLSGPDTDRAPVAPRLDRRVALGSVLRAVLLIGGIMWSLAMLVEWTAVGPFNASAALWFRWIVEHQVPAFLAILAALFPSGTLAALRSLGRPSALALRGGLVVAGAILLLGAPPPFAGAGIEGLGNELMGVLGLPAAWGAVAPVFAPGLDLYFRWGFQYGLLGGFAVAAGAAPLRAFVPLLWTVGANTGRDGSSVRSPAASGGPSPVAVAPTGFDVRGPVAGSSPAPGTVVHGP